MTAVKPGMLRQESEPEAQKTHAAGSESFGHRSKAGEHHEKTVWDTVLLSRKADRPTALDYINAVFDEFIEFHGDRYFKDDGAIVGGIAMFHGMPVTVIGQQKGKIPKTILNATLVCLPRMATARPCV